jgi:hypothetical protein
MGQSRARRLAPLAVVGLATALLAQKAIGGILAKVGHPAAALDDAYIHFQYARAFAEGHPFRYQAGEPISTGATSLLWPLLLAPFHALGFRGDALLWPAWLLAFAALGALAWEAFRIAQPLAGRPAAAGAAAMVLAFGGFTWCAASGMEVLPFAWSIAFVTRRAAEWAESPADARTVRALRPLLAIAVAAPLLRPEGSLTAVAVAAIVFRFPPAGAGAGSPVPVPVRARAWSLAFVAAALGPTLVLLALTGHTTSSTAQVKLVFGSPYHAPADTFAANAKLLFGTILDGEVWSAEFLPRGGAALACAGLLAIVWRGAASGRGVRAALVLLLALSMLVPCFYVTFLWNRLRYLWPFATGWLVGLACLARAIGDLAAAARLGPRVALTTSALLAGAFAGALAVRLDWVLDDVAQSASGIARQQAALGRWAEENLPRDARIGVNDTGAIAYFGQRRTFDVVGLTTPSEGRYWVAGSASRLEHYERMRVSSPQLLPTHFIVYPEWMGCEPVLGRALHQATVTDATILGGQTMRVYEARWDLLGSGERPWSPFGALHDALDVADLESERDHAYELRGAREGEQTAEEGNAPDGAIVVDGGRTNRATDAFVANLPAGAPLAGIARVQATAPTTLRIAIDGKAIAEVPVEPGPWTEVVFDVPDDARGDHKRVEVNAAGATFTSFHYWFAVKP